MKPKISDPQKFLNKNFQTIQFSVSEYITAKAQNRVHLLRTGEFSNQVLQTWIAKAA